MYRKQHSLAFLSLRFGCKNTVGSMNNKLFFFFTKRVTYTFCLKHIHNLVTKHPLISRITFWSHMHCVMKSSKWVQESSAKFFWLINLLWKKVNVETRTIVFKFGHRKKSSIHNYLCSFSVRISTTGRLRMRGIYENESVSGWF